MQIGKIMNLMKENTIGYCGHVGCVFSVLGSTNKPLHVQLCVIIFLYSYSILGVNFWVSYFLLKPFSKKAEIMPVVQDILVFYQTTPALDSSPAAWAYYEASKGPVRDLVEESEPPYKNAMAAMRDGWQVIQMSEYKQRSLEDGYELGPLPYQTVLQKFNELKEEGA